MRVMHKTYLSLVMKNRRFNEQGGLTHQIFVKYTAKTDGLVIISA